MEKWIACIQTNYIPWKGYFDFINLVDEFILLDDVQYTRRDWRNRNKIKTSQGLKWLTIPVKVKGKYNQLIHEVEIKDDSWVDAHLKTLQHNYSQAPHYAKYIGILQDLYASTSSSSLSEINHHFLKGLCDLLGIDTKLSWSMDFDYDTKTIGPNERIVSLCKQSGATHYLTGPAAKDYLDNELFIHEGIQLVYMDYSSYAEYPQLFPPFEHSVSVLDLLLNTGDDARNYLNSFGKNSIRNS